MAGGRATDIYRITTGDGRSTEELVEAGNYGYAHSCVNSENFPARHFCGKRVREVVLVEFDRNVTSEEVMTEAAQLRLERPTYEDALHFGIEYPDVQRQRPVVFLHDPWFGFFGRRDVVCLWSNAGEGQSTVVTTMSGSRGRSYGSSIPVKLPDPPRRALASMPFGSRRSHFSSGVST